MKRMVSIALIWLCLFASNIRAQEIPPHVELRATKTSVKLGEPFEIYFQFYSIPKQAIAFRVPASVRNLTILNEAEVPKSQDSAASLSYEYKVKAALYSLDPITIDDASFDITDENLKTKLGASTIKALPITFEPVKLQTGPDLKPLKPPALLQLNVWPYLLALSLFAALSFLLFSFIRWFGRKLEQRKQRLAEAVENGLEPFSQAIQALEALEADRAFERYEAKPFFDQLSAVLKRYLDRTIRYPFMDMTTSEIEAVIRKNPSRDYIDDRRAQAIIGFLRGADLVKFANIEKQSTEKRETLAAVDQIIRAVQKIKEARDLELEKQQLESQRRAV